MANFIWFDLEAFILKKISLYLKHFFLSKRHAWWGLKENNEGQNQVIIMFLQGLKNLQLTTTKKTSRENYIH